MVFILLVGIVVALLTAARIWPQQIRGAFARIDGAVILVEPTEITLPLAPKEPLRPIPEGETPPRDEILFRITNLLNEPVRILGEESSCNCIRQDKYPLSIPPRGDVNIRFDVLRRDHPFEHSIRLYTDPAGIGTKLIVRSK